MALSASPWQRLVRVLGHELNNSLAPIKSLSHSLQGLFLRSPRPADWEDDLRVGLQVISDRSEALSRFMTDYSRLASLPKPNLRPVPVAPLLRRIAALDRRLPVRVEAGPEAMIDADPDQLEQLLINILRNAIDASLQMNGGVSLSWKTDGRVLRVQVLDDGPGIANPANLFVPFFTTKQGGSGIGLALSRQIAEAHGGQLLVANRENARGCAAIVELPVELSSVGVAPAIGGL